MQHIKAPLVGFETVPAIEDMLLADEPGYQARPTGRFPVRYLRYWFVRHVLENLHGQLRRPLRVLEVGIGYGKMLAFMGGPKIDQERHALPDMIERWDALSAEADPRTLRRYSYSSFREADIESPLDLGNDTYDVVVLLHVLEHLAEPDAAMRRLLSVVLPGGVLVGGSPTMPHLVARVHEPQLRRKYADRMHDIRIHKHLSVITPKRIRDFAKREGLQTDLLAGTFFLRASGSPLENHAWWLRANLAWGALFPSLGGEVYFSVRKAA